MGDTKILKNYFVIAIVISTISSFNVVFAQEIFPRKEFIKITEEAINAVDKLEAGFLYPLGITRVEARQLHNNFSAVLKRYDRYSSYKKTDTQNLIFSKLIMLNLQYMKLSLELELEKVEHDDLQEALQTADELRGLFYKYKKRKT